MADSAFCDGAVAKVAREFGGLDILVNDAAEQHLRERREDLRTVISVGESVRRPRVPIEQPASEPLHGRASGGRWHLRGAHWRDPYGAGLVVVIVDRHGPVLGSTPASTARLQYELETPLSLLVDRLGRTNAERVWLRSCLALDALRERSHHTHRRGDLP